MQKLFILACAALVMAGCAKQKDPTMKRILISRSPKLKSNEKVS